MGKKNNSGAYEIALSGICCAVAAGGLALGIVSGYLVVTGYMIGIVALMVPLSKNFYKGDFFAYLGTCILAVALGASVQFWDLVPFVMFFGLHPLANALQVKFKINKWLAYAIKALWFDATLVVAYLLIFGGNLFGTLLPEEFYAFLNSGYIYLFIFTLGTALFFIYDYLVFKIQVAVNMAVRMIRK